MPQTSESVGRHSETLCCRRVSDGIWMYLMVSGCFWHFQSFHIFSCMFWLFHILSRCFRAVSVDLLRQGSAVSHAQWCCRRGMRRKRSSFEMNFRKLFESPTAAWPEVQTQDQTVCLDMFHHFVIFSPMVHFFFWFGEPKLYIGLRTRMLLACVEWFSMMASWSLYEPIFLEHVITW
jgi:hypothetical protein